MRRSNARRATEALEPDTTMDAAASKLNQQLLRRPVPVSTRHSSLSKQQKRCWGGRGCVLLLAASALLSVLLYLQLLHGSSGSCKFSIYIDGGSTGTRIHVFAYRTARGAMVPLLDFGLTASIRVLPGLSYYSGEPELAGGSLMELLRFAKGRVPRKLWAETEIRLMATAGLRLLDVAIVERILGSCRKVLRSSEFRFQDDWATVISGSDEGIYAWIAANYALGTLGGDPNNTIGIFELGGASAQITFFSSEPLPPEFTHMLNFGTVTYNLYSHSFLHLGQNVAYESLHELLRSRFRKSSAESLQKATYRDPCTPRGYTNSARSLKLSSDISNSKTQSRAAHAIGNFSECRKATLMLLEKGKDKCLYEKCHLGSAYVPKLQGRLLATENFFHTSKFFRLGQTSLLSDVILAGERFCNEDWANLKQMYHTLDEEDLLPYCFSSAYMIALLHDSLGITVNDNRIMFANQVGNVPLDWALGAFIMQKASNLDGRSSNWIFSTLSNDSSTLFFFIVVSSVLVFTAWFLVKCRKPQLRTIYDLEKGRYILMRVNR